jgi:glycopeptide antibiotics resistance protein
MWLHLGGSYWQRVSVDAVIVVAALIGLMAFARSIKRFESRHLWSFLALGLVLAIFVVALFSAGNKLGTVVGPKLQELEASSSP